MDPTPLPSHGDPWLQSAESLDCRFEEASSLFCTKICYSVNSIVSSTLCYSVNQNMPLHSVIFPHFLFNKSSD
ncbi:hypothetical protein PVAP13_4KG240400 [Panicum virgatum]|uniref:Uncharacterized protein n=1 Tax=Panicum virgatum TaxID=38727 RepID=A0A8T0TRY4_PANVG|nr:hypothetical protein PVAP13_4KG240400 [Panicum virgatum]